MPSAPCRPVSRSSRSSFQDGPLGAQAGSELGPRSHHRAQAWDTFQTLLGTAKKLGLNFFHYLRDRSSAAPGDALVSGSHSPTSERSPTLLLLGTLMISPPRYSEDSRWESGGHLGIQGPATNTTLLSVSVRPPLVPLVSVRTPLQIAADFLNLEKP